MEKKEYKVKIRKENLKKAKKYILIGSLIASVALLSSCDTREIAVNSNAIYDTIDTTDDKLVTSGVLQVIDVPNEDFKLVVNYQCVLKDNEKWTITDDKQIYTEISTKGLKEGYKVFVDNVHTDTTIRSIYPSIDGITQDSMDDRLHGEQLLGFPISDTNTYGNINCIEGQNDSFINGTMLGFSGYAVSGTVTQKRFVESDYLSHGVYANKIASVIDLIIVKPDGTITCTSVPSTIMVSVWPYIETRNTLGGSSYVYYKIDPLKGEVNTESLDYSEYLRHTNQGKPRSK